MDDLFKNPFDNQFSNITTFGTTTKINEEITQIVEWSNGEAVQFSDGQKLEW